MNQSAMTLLNYKEKMEKHTFTHIHLKNCSGL